MLPSVYGCSAQQTATPTLTTSVSGVNWRTQYYGADNDSKVAIPVEQQIASSVSSANSWTMPENGIAYQYSEANPLQVQHSTVIQYDSSELSDSDLPRDEACGLRISIVSNSGTSPFFGVNFANSGATRYPSKAAGTVITIGGLNRSDVNAGATTSCPEFLIAGIGGSNLAFDPPDARPITLRNYSFNASDPASGYSGNLQYKVEVLLDDGTYTSASFQSITVPANAIKQYVFEPPVWTLSEVRTITTKIDPSEIDKEALNVDVNWEYPLEFYEATQNFINPKDAHKYGIITVESLIGTGKEMDGFGFTHGTDDCSEGPKNNPYNTLESMKQKTVAQFELGETLYSVDNKDQSSRLINRHLIRDMRGNLRAYGQQKVRCVKCGTSYRRPPLSGKCTTVIEERIDSFSGKPVVITCPGKVILTVSKGSVMKYEPLMNELVEKYDCSPYIKETHRLVSQWVGQSFDEEGSKDQESLF